MNTEGSAANPSGRSRAEHMERALVESEAGYRALISQVKDYAIFGMDRAGRAVTWNEGVQAVLGYGREEFLGSALELCFLPEDIAAGIPDQELETARVEGVANDDRWLRRKNGSPFFATGRTTRLTNASGQLVGFTKVLRDDTQRALAEGALRRSEMRYRLLLQNLCDYAIYMLDRNGTITEWPEGAQRVTGYSSEEVLGHHISMFYTPEQITAGEPSAELAETEQNGRAEREQWRLRKGAERIWVNEIATAVHDLDGKLMGFTMISRNLTERKAADERLRQHTERLNFLTESANALLAADRPTEFLDHLYDRLVSLLGLELYIHFAVVPAGTHLELAACRGLSEEQCRAISTLQFGEAVCGEVARSGEPMILEDVQSSTDARTALIRGLGITRYVCHPLIARGTTVGTLSFGARSGTRFDDSDIDLIRTACDQVATAIERDRAAEALRESETALREADRRKDEFLATLAHELRNPLAPLRNGLQIARLMSGPNPPLQRNVEMMERQLNHLVYLVNDLLDVARISSGKVELRREPINLARVLTESIEASRGIIESHGHELAINMPGQELVVEGDFDRLTQVFFNLLSNAAKYTERGGRIEVRLRGSDKDASVEISDTGIGIPPADLPHVFDLFSQVRVHQGLAQGGLGIGLSLVRNLVTLHRGTVAAASDGINSGSTFTVTLPLRTVKPSAHLPDREQEPMRAPERRRILVVDDNEDAAQSLALLLGLDGHEVDIAHDGYTAIAQTEQLHPELIFLDLGMPRIDGIETARRLREIPNGKDVVLVALTGWGQDTDRQRTREAGFDHHIVKPVDVQKLNGLLASLSQRQR